MKYKYYIDEKKYRIKSNERYIRINGWCFEGRNEPCSYESVVNGKRTECRVKKIERKDVWKKYKGKYNVPKECGFHIKTYMAEGEVPESYKLYLKSESGDKCLVSLGKREIQAMTDNSIISYNLDFIGIEPLKIKLSGWAASVNGTDKIKIKVIDSENKLIDMRLQRHRRKDVFDIGLVGMKDIDCGFTIEFIYEENKVYNLIIEDGIKRKKIILDPIILKKNERKNTIKIYTKKFVKALNGKNIKKGMHYLSRNGFKGLIKQMESFLKGGKDYQIWFEENKVTPKQLEKQGNTKFIKNPKISIIVPTYKTPENFLREMIDSVREQSYSNWELCIADGSGGDAAVESILEEYAALDKRIRFTILKENFGISGNTNAALDMVTGDYVGLFDHDDILTPDALFEVTKALQEKEYDILYTDEDKMTGDGVGFNDPNFKPDFGMDLFCSHNFITHFFVVKTEIIKKIGGFRSEFDGSQDYDLMFRCIENADTIKHIPKILYHWRIHMNSVAGDPESKMYAYEAGKRAIEEHLERSSIDATVEHVGLWGMYHVKYGTPGEPRISIIIPNKDHVSDLKKCIGSIIKKSTYKNYEFIIIENNSENKETFEYYEMLENNYSNVKIVYWKGAFNYSSINNYGVQQASGEYLLFLNNDTEIITPDALSEMLGNCMRDDVGAVGAKLLYPDNTVQHGGIVVGFGNYAGHVNTGIERDGYGYMVRARINCNYSAVTAACMLTKKTLFEQVGGFDEQFVVACNDVDYCLKLREIGKLVVFNAFAEWYHYESKSRGYEDTPEKLKRYEGEVAKFQEKWSDILEKGDPFYNPNFAINQAPFTLS